MLKFNKEHDLKELEKYGFDYDENEFFNNPLYTNGYINIWVKNLQVDVYFLNSHTTNGVNELYDLIKNGLVVKE